MIKAAARGVSSGASAPEQSQAYLSFSPFSLLLILHARDGRVRSSEVSVPSSCQISETTAGEDGDSPFGKMQSMNKGPR